MFNVGGSEILVILVIALIFLGPHRLPTAGRQIGKALADFRRVTSGVQQDLKDALDVDGVRESIDTFREVVDVRKTIATEFASALSATGAASAGAMSTKPGPAGEPSSSPAPVSSAVPPPDGLYADDRADAGANLLGGVDVAPPRLGGFEDILARPPEPTA